MFVILRGEELADHKTIIYAYIAANVVRIHRTALWVIMVNM